MLIPCLPYADRLPDATRFHTHYSTKQTFAEPQSVHQRPHVLQHRQAPYALGRARTIAELKAVSQNLMHRSLFTTDEIYGMLTESDTRERVVNLANKESADDGLSALVDQIAERLAQKLGL